MMQSGEHTKIGNCRKNSTRQTVFGRRQKTLSGTLIGKSLQPGHLEGRRRHQKLHLLSSAGPTVTEHGAAD